MQDKYVGDIGDFGKYALLKHMRKEMDLSLGIVWYLVNPDHTDGGHQINDGKHISYLGINKKPDMELRDRDPDLFDRLHSIVDEKRRKVESVKTDGILGTNVTFFARPISTSILSKKSRAAWLAAAMKAVEEKDIIFLDPDNGLASDAKDGKAKLDAKYVFRTELKEFWGHGKRVIVLYHHPNRKGKGVDHDAQISKLAEELKNNLDGSRVLPLRYRRGTSRAYFVIVPENEAEQWRRSLQEFAAPWPNIKSKGKSVRTFECKFNRVELINPCSI